MKTLISPSKSPETTTSPVRSFPAPGGKFAFLILIENNFFTFTRLLSPGYGLKQQVWYGSKERAGHNGTVGFYCLVVVIPVFPRCDRLLRKNYFVM